MRKVIALLIAGLWVAGDYFSKQWALETLSHQVIHVNDFMNFRLAFNPGAAFSFLANLGGIQRWLFVVLGVAICLWLLYIIFCHRLPALDIFAYSSILGGAIGNLMDRTGWLELTGFANNIGHINNPMPGQVIDFIQWHYKDIYYWPTFNIADTAITIGVICVLVQWVMSLFKNDAYI